MGQANIWTIDATGSLNNAYPYLQNVDLYSSLSDSIAPTLTLNGETEITLEVFLTYTEEGATALDDVDGDITSNIITVIYPQKADYGWLSKLTNISKTIASITFNPVDSGDFIDIISSYFQSFIKYRC